MEQPFYIGQKVVCIKSISNNLGRIVKGRVYTVLDLKQCKKCKSWNVGFVADSTDVYFECCGTNQGKPKFLYALASRFAPLQEGFEAITFERVMEEEKVSVN